MIAYLDDGPVRNRLVRGILRMRDVGVESPLGKRDNAGGFQAVEDRLPCVRHSGLRAQKAHRREQEIVRRRVRFMGYASSSIQPTLNGVLMASL